ncbi:hypothetical protein QOZ80_6BG0496740 [Eleusine coracana subsp. coracana]|nr:hypothetical protein QOZ80_6BG0496740 [Eleusine coracana subsp. coracana]
MEIPVINMDELYGEKRSETLSLLHDACAKWGFFWLENHGVNEELMHMMKVLVDKYYEHNMEKSFYNSEMAKTLEYEKAVSDVDWECSFMYRHQPKPNSHDIPEALRTTIHDYAEELVKVAEKLAEFMSENLGLDKDYLKKAFSEPSVGMKVAKYPRCHHPKLVMGLREHTDAGGIILLFQDDLVPGLEFMKEGPDAIIYPAPKLTYPTQYRFQDYLNFYSTAKFTDKVSRFQSTKMIFK